MASREGADLGADLVGELRDDDLGWMDTLDAVGAAAPRPVAKCTGYLPAVDDAGPPPPCVAAPRPVAKRTGYHPAADDAAGPPPPKRTKPAARTPARPLAPPGVRLAPEERARIEKERNREHARNTRARKKEALGKLRRDVAGLEEAALERDAAAEQDRQVSQRRLAVLQCVFRKRGEGLLDRAEWGKYLESGFVLRQPLNPHQACRPADVEGHVKVCRGVDGFVEDVASLGVLMRSVGRSAELSYRVAARPAWKSSVLPPAPTVVQDAVYGHWGACTTDARRHGAAREAGVRGLFCAFFVGYKLTSLELVYDVNSLARDMVRSTAAPLMRVPGCLRDATFDADPAARVVTRAVAPFEVVDCNQAWLDLCAFPAKQAVVGRTLRVIQGPLTDAGQLQRLHAHVARGVAFDTTLLNYKGDGQTFINYLRVCPVFPDRDRASKPSHYLGILQDLMSSEVADDARMNSSACPLCRGTGRAPAAPAVY